MAGYPPAPPPPGQPGPPQGPYGPQNPYGPQQGYGGYPPQNPYGAQQPYGPPGGPPVPPGGPMPPYPNQPAPRRTGVIVGVIAGGLALLLGAGGVVTWVLMQPPAAYAELPACDDVVTEAVTDITGQRNSDVEEYVVDSSNFPDNADRKLEELVDCGVFEDANEAYSSDEFLGVGLSRYASNTVEDDYERVHRAAEKSDSGGTTEEVTEPEEVAVGDTAIQYMAEYSSEYLYGEDPGGSMSVVQAADRNMVVTVWYRASDRVSDEEKQEISLGVANEIVRILPDAADVEE